MTDTSLDLFAADPSPAVEPTNTAIVIACLVIVGALGLVGAVGGIYLIGKGQVSEAQTALVFSLGSGALTGVLGFMTGRSTAKA